MSGSPLEARAPYTVTTTATVIGDSQTEHATRAEAEEHAKALTTGCDAEAWIWSGEEVIAYAKDGRVVPQVGPEVCPRCGAVSYREPGEVCASCEDGIQ